MGTNDREVLINELQGLVGVHLSREACAFFLEMSNWCVIIFVTFFIASVLKHVTCVDELVFLCVYLPSLPLITTGTCR